MKRVLVGIVRMILKSSGGIGRLELTELEERIFGGDCRGGSMRK